MPQSLTETTPLSEAGTSTSKSGRMKVRAISAGVGSSGYYSPEVIEQAAKDQLITEGTHLYLDHPTDAEAVERPARSVKDIAAIFTETATYDPDTKSLVGEVQVVAPYRDLLADLAPHIGLSIRGDGELVEGEHDGRQMKIVESLHAINSVDFVTRAGRGGKVLSLVESARTNRRAIAHGVSEATVNDTREGLTQVLRDAYGTGEGVWIYVRDFDDTTVWFEIEGAGDDTGIYGQGYTESAGVVALTGEREEVRVVTNYVPVTRPDSNTPTTTESLEDNMGKIQIEEAEHTRLNEKAGRVDELLTENATLKEENAGLKEAEAKRVRTKRAGDIVSERAKEAGVTYNEREARSFLLDLPLKEDGTLDEDAFATAVDEDAAKRKADTGAGTVLGFGEGGKVQESGTSFWDDIDNDLGISKGA